ncbi:MAG: hypothetical protein M3530_10330 [Thermoproteota archaeon]|nr:hypothetical protein [Thermoproteota archaeon]
MNKTPSNELASLIKETVETYFSVRELWSKVLDKGQEEGFTEKELQDIVRPLLKDMLTRHQIRYLFHREEMKDASKKAYDKMRNITQIDNSELPKEFYEELDTMALIEKESKDAISLAIEIAKKEGFSDQEIEQLIREYLKDYVPKGTLNEWLRTQD